MVVSVMNTMSLPVYTPLGVSGELLAWSLEVLRELMGSRRTVLRAPSILGWLGGPWRSVDGQRDGSLSAAPALLDRGAALGASVGAALGVAVGAAGATL